MGKHAFTDDVATGFLSSNLEMASVVSLYCEILVPLGNSKNRYLDVRRRSSISRRHGPGKPTIRPQREIDIRALGPLALCHKRVPVRAQEPRCVFAVTW